MERVSTAVAQVDLAAVLPDPLLQRPRFLFSRDKRPHYVNGRPRAEGGFLDTPADLKQLATLRKAKAKLSPAFDGFGFAVVKDDGIGFIDLDGIILPDGELDPDHEGYDLAIEAEVAGAFIEVSCSGRGLHIFGAASGSYKSKKPVEIYTGRRFAALTGNLWKGGRAKGWIDLDDLPALKARATPPRMAGERVGGDLEGDVAQETYDELRDALRHLDPDDRDEWVNNAMRLKTLPDEEQAKAIWVEWSERSKKWCEKGHKDDLKWDEVEPHRTGYKAIFSLAQEAGWKNPKKAERRSAAEAFGGEPDDDEPVDRGSGLYIECGQEILEAARREPASWLIKGWMEEQGVGLIFGHPGSGKSFLGLALAMHVALGREWFGHKTKQGTVFYIAAEGQAGLRNRVDAFCREHGITQNFPLVLIPQPLNLFDSKSDLAALRQVIEEQAAIHGKPALIIADTLSMTLGSGRENTDEVGVYLRHCAELAAEHNCFVMPIHHRPKDDSSKWPRGHSSLVGNTDTILLVEDLGGLRSVSITKQRNGEAKDRVLTFGLKVHNLGVDEDGEPVTSCTIEARVGALTAVPSNPLDKATARINASVRSNNMGYQAGVFQSFLALRFEAEDPVTARVSEEDWKRRAVTDFVHRSGHTSKYANRKVGEYIHLIKTLGIVQFSDGFVTLSPEYEPCE